ncbi:MAG: flagellar biosynthesis protein FlhB [Fusobacteriia bacterium 4572_132]|nr:MAG: flagellar biosynthesis protein FlhB [Fusobacteriia bacterium 4572_132]
MKKAVGIRYKEEKDNAPKIIAKGQGKVAEKIIEIAEENGINIKKDKNLLEILYKMDIAEEIPEELYEVMAEILTYIYRLDEKRR